MRKYAQVYLLTILLLTNSCCLFGQNNPLIDSLKLELKTAKQDTCKIRVLLKMAYQYSFFDLVNAKTYIKQAKDIAKKLDNQEIKADFFFQEGNINLRSEEYKYALENFDKALALFTKYKNKPKMALTYLNMGYVYSENTDLNKAMENFTKAEKIYKELNDKNSMGICYRLFGTIYVYQEKYDKALDYFNMAIKLIDRHNHYELANIYVNISATYYNLREFKKGVSYIDSVVPAYEKRKNYDGLNSLYLNCGLMYTYLKEYDKAKSCILKSKYYASKLNTLLNLTFSEMAHAFLYDQINLPDSAIIILKHCIDYNKILKIPEIEKDIYIRFVEAYEKKGDMKSALEYHKKYTTVNDSITKELNSKKLLEIQTQYEVDIKNEQIKLLVKDKQLASQKIVILGIGLLTMLISGLFIIVYKHRKAKEKQLKYELEIKEAAYKIGTKHRELTYKAIHISQQENILSHIRLQLEDFKTDNPRSKDSILELLSCINRQLKQNSFEDFEKYFVEVHPEFYNNLKGKYADLTQNELRVCALLRLNLKSKQIADITGKSIRSIETTRTDIRKKMGLTLQDNLFEIISKH